MQTQEIGEPVDVAVVCKDGKAPVPKWFVWSGRRHAVDRVEHVWKSRDGRMPLWGFSVLSGADVYELQWNPQTLRWLLEKVHLKG
jgi:hypothetical protein